ncbi:MAG: hypothetical protein JWM90_1543 [Thermoleophilia bacterium]|nr:hypothetical protein [Thermoleophilia bacterium]
MALNIKNERAIELARQVAELTGETMTGAIVESLEQRLQLLTAADDDFEARVARVMAIARETGPMLRGLDMEAAMDELYDEKGLPR